MKMWEYFEYLFKTNCIFFSIQFKTVICQDIDTWNIVVRVYMDYVTNCFGRKAKSNFFQVQFNLVRRITDCRHSKREHSFDKYKERLRELDPMSPTYGNCKLTSDLLLTIQGSRTGQL